MSTKKVVKPARPAVKSAQVSEEFAKSMEAEPTKVRDGDTFFAKDRVQYLGTEFSAYRGSIGTVVAKKDQDHSAITLDGASTPVILPNADLIIHDDPNMADSAALMTGNKPRFRYIANTSGGLYVIPDLRSETEPEGISLQAGEKLDLLQFFTVQQINRCSSMIMATQRLSESNNLPFITVLNSLEDPLPEGAIVVPMGLRVAAGTVIEAEPNVFDDKYAADLEKEDKRNEQLKAKSIAERRTNRHGKASDGLGGRR